jgi:hypothetical protein
MRARARFRRRSAVRRCRPGCEAAKAQHDAGALAAPEPNRERPAIDAVSAGAG